jgi:hypothetical protein
LNYDFFASSTAHDYALLKIQTIDDRFPTLDDPLLLRLLPYRYEYVETEKDYTLWKRRAQIPVSAPVPHMLRSTHLDLNATFQLGDLMTKNLWVRIELQPSLAGRLRKFIYKPPVVDLLLEDTDGATDEYTIPLSQARTGFILNPLIDDTDDYVNFATGRPTRHVRSFKLEVPDPDKVFFADDASVEIYELPSLTPATR